jgi:Fic family protein
LNESERTFHKTHPWLKFTLDLQRAPHTFWMILGEIRSKCEHIAGTPLDKETADRLYRLYLTRGVQATTAIEGNMLSEDEVRQRIEGTLELAPSMAYQGQEIDNMVAACNNILRDAADAKPVVLTVELVKDLNRQVLASLPLPDNVIPGVIRQGSVVVGSYRGAPAADCEHLLERMCSFIKEPPAQGVELDPLSRAVLLAIWTHLYLAWIHPFGDGNGRTARLAEFMILLEGGVPAPAAHILSNHYNKTRQVYYLELDKASRSGGDVVPFLMYALSGFLDGLKVQLQEISRFQHLLIWRDYVREMLHARGVRDSAQVSTRRLDLAIALAERETVPASKLSLLTPEIARAYAKKTAKTLSRDVNALAELGLIEVSSVGVRARVEIIQAFLPPRPR